MHYIPSFLIQTYLLIRVRTLLTLNTIETPEDVDQRIENGVLDVFLETKEKGLTRYIGFTEHRSPVTHLHFLKRMEELGVELDTCQLPLNVLDPIFESFQKNALPVSSLVSGCNTPEELEHNIGVLQNLKKLSESDMLRLDEHVKPYAGGIVENYKWILN